MEHSGFTGERSQRSGCISSREDELTLFAYKTDCCKSLLVGQRNGSGWRLIAHIRSTAWGPALHAAGCEVGRSCGSARHGASCPGPAAALGAGLDAAQLRADGGPAATGPALCGDGGCWESCVRQEVEEKHSWEESGYKESSANVIMLK